MTSSAFRRNTTDRSALFTEICAPAVRSGRRRSQGAVTRSCPCRPGKPAEFGDLTGDIPHLDVALLGRVSKVASSARRAGAAVSGACDRKAEGRPDTGCIGVIPTTRRACVPGTAGQAGLSTHALGGATQDVERLVLGEPAAAMRMPMASQITCGVSTARTSWSWMRALDSATAAWEARSHAAVSLGSSNNPGLRENRFRAPRSSSSVNSRNPSMLPAPSSRAGGAYAGRRCPRTVISVMRLSRPSDRRLAHGSSADVAIGVHGGKRCLFLSPSGRTLPGAASTGRR